MRSPIILRVFKEKKLVEVKQFDQAQIVIGNGGDVQLELLSPHVSPIHCLIELRDNGYYICDLGSKTGTTKNGQPVLDDLISSGDEIAVGDFTISFSIGVPKPILAPVVAQEIPLPVSAPMVPQGPPANVSRELERDDSSAVTQTIGFEKVEAYQVPPLPKVGSISPIPAVAPTEKPVAEVSDFDIDLDKTARVTLIKNDNGKRLLVKDSGAGRPEILGTPLVPQQYLEKGFKKIKKGRKTFAPPSPVSDLRQYITPGRGGNVEVIVCWKDRIIDSKHLRRRGTFTIGSSSECDIVIPSGTFNRSWNLVTIDSGVTVMAPSDSDAVYITNQGVRLIGQMGSKTTIVSNQINMKLDQGEAISIRVANSEIEVFVRFAPQTPLIPMMPPILLNSSEMTGMILSVIIVALLALWVIATKPVPSVDDQGQKDRIAQVVFELPKLKPPPPPPPPKVEPKVEAKVEPPKPDVTRVKVADKTQDPTKKGKATEVKKAVQVAHRAAEVAPIPNSQKKPKIFTSTKQGGAFKQGDTAGANADSAKPKDLSKLGLFSAFGGGGHRTKLDQAYSGAGDVLGSADKATGSAGFNEDRPGDDLGSKFKDVGAGGKGTQTSGISGVNTKGRSSGQSAYGSVNGFGNKSSVNIDAGGSDADFVGTIDKEAVRRVIRTRLAEIKSCYERVLSHLPKGTHLEGKVVMAWSIVEAGGAKEVRVKNSTLNNAEVENCIREKLSSWQFPEPPKGMIAEVEAYPFVFMQSQ